MKIKRIETYLSVSDGEETVKYLSALSEFDENDHEILSVTFTPDGEIEHKTTYAYNSEGLKVSEINYFDESEVSDSHAFEYDEQKRLVKETVDFVDGSQTIKTFVRNAEEKTVTVSAHDDEGQLEEMEWVKMNAENKVIERKNFDDEENLKEHITYMHDEAGNVINAKEFDETGELLLETIQEFNSFNEPVKRIARNAKGENIDYTLYAYDEQNRVLEVKFGNRYLIKHEYNDQERTHTEMRILGSGHIDEKVKYFYSPDGKVIKEERLDSVLEYNYEYFE